ncbi:sugar isomerase domain-containing protein [Oceanobacillus piezotolerans]|uniref:UPF0309 protein D8M04_17910 n=1 Tax=Oceanobacillus piezotolerans TaxID=2448030 RepID=A0A498D2L1_9BACI|nr:SIS domain-containing protein [Oceanobacillus piezotolerans]RLL41118.1 sugar isomerase domain-containing protein [Oceanobacillus piezotolerans]
MLHQYFSKVKDLLSDVENKETDKLSQASEKIVKSFQNGGIVHLFGCGHSHMIGEEVYYRAGGLVPIHPILHEPLMLHEGATRSSELEKQPDYAKSFMEEQDIRKEDVLIVTSTSGRNPVPIDAALIAKEKGAFVITISSFIYAENQTSRHPSGKFLHEVADVAIDNHIPVGDALLSHEKAKVNFASGSTIIGVSIINALMAEVIASMAEAGLEPPVLISGNIDGSEEHNQGLLEKYKTRISF